MFVVKKNQTIRSRCSLIAPITIALDRRKPFIIYAQLNESIEKD